MTNGYPTNNDLCHLMKKLLTLLTLVHQRDVLLQQNLLFLVLYSYRINIEYAFCVISNTDEYTMYTTRLGQTTLDATRLISQQPYLVICLNHKMLLHGLPTKMKMLNLKLIVLRLQQIQSKYCSSCK